ncbi:GntR family transcriptional regulator [Actinomadura madurae]|uniref:GntR family transcriptional regulator n=1 Tax=Actinomadura madurae TaxID=1993 RepID=UPI0020D2389A|nr:GntR family transcriptional regulator [Actinomadura madurae]MCP9972532.1 GntR family transcriptional regulator [Actinomadura madurae]MCP9985033.1 GntR family transcriptional regulator [Actinomadura madurae]
MAISGGRALGRRRQLSDEVADYVRELIMSGQVRHGEFLRLERVADDLGISVTPVREALLSLRGEGFVTLEPRRGFMPAPLTRQDVQDLFEAQAYFAGELAARAAGRITEGSWRRSTGRRRSWKRRPGPATRRPSSAPTTSSTG